MPNCMLLLLRFAVNSIMTTTNDNRATDKSNLGYIFASLVSMCGKADFKKHILVQVMMD